jgi:hypothetical protein
MESIYNFRTSFFPLGEVDVSFLNLLSTAINNFIKPKVDFFANKSFGTVHLHALLCPKR